jgi:hypothetical protein
MHLWCKFYVGRPLFAEAQLDGLQSVINQLLPDWSSDLRVAKDEDSPPSMLVGRAGRLYDCLHQVAPPKRRLGSAVLTGAYKGLSFFLQHFEGTLPPELNRMAIEVYGPSTVEGQSTSNLARMLFEAVVVQLPMRYANSRLDEEFRAKNMIDDETGVEAIGVDITEAIPGLFWLNYLGAPYVDLIGRERLLTAPAFEVKPVGDGVLLALDSSAEAWQSDAYHARERATIEHIGKQYFFSRWDLDRQTVAPDFGAYRDRGQAD